MEKGYKARFSKKILKNGMTVVFEQRRGSGVISAAFAVRHGGINESEEEKGISHFIEHMLYKGTKKRTAKQISEDIEKNGGILNGFTDDEITAFWCKMPSNKISLGMAALSDMLKNSVFDKKELDKERRVIFEEIKMRRDRPDIYVIDKIQSLLYTGGLASDRIGTIDTLSSIDRTKIMKKFKSIYGSENMILCVVGDANFDYLCNFCEKTFKRSGFKIPELNIGFKNEEKISKRADVSQANLVFAYHAPVAFNDKSYAAQVLSCLMAGGMSSRLFQEIREKRNLAYSVRGSYNGGKRFGYNSIFVGTPPQNVKKVKQIILEEFKKIKNLGDRELNRFKEQLIGNSKISREDSQGQMMDLLYHEIWGDAKKSYGYEANIKKVRLVDVKRLANFERYSFIALIPENRELKK